MSKHIGIVACSAEGAALCYRTICLEGADLFGRHNHPEVSLHNHSLRQYMICIEKDDWNAVADLMLSSAHKLATVGADFLICPDNTIHQALPQVVNRSPLPWLHIAEEVAKVAEQDGFQKLALLGTKYLMEGPVYPPKLAERRIEFLIPNQDERIQINHVIFDELVNGLFLDESRAYFQKVIQRLKEEGCDATVLGCTEIPLLIRQDDSPLPILDSTRLLARAALRYSL
jgi:aspartate racemase